MKKSIVISTVLSFLGIAMIVIAIMLQGTNSKYKNKKNNVIKKEQIDVKNMASSYNKKIKSVSSDAQVQVSTPDASAIVETTMEQAPRSVVEVPIVVPQRIEVYEGLTIEELSAKLDRNLNSTIAGKGNLIATKSLELGIDPYVAVAIMLHETGCRYSCSSLVRQCNNVGGQKGSPSCGGGEYKSYPTLDEGIVGFLNNLYTNYYSKGLNTIYSIGPRYAASTTWSNQVSNYVSYIRNN